jgi:hypothetical protein
MPICDSDASESDIAGTLGVRHLNAMNVRDLHALNHEIFVNRH